MSADAFGAFEEIDLNDPSEVNKLGVKFRNTVLALGGGTHPAEVFKMFRGREPNVDALLRHNGL
jgi:oligopeptidase A